MKRFVSGLCAMTMLATFGMAGPASAGMASMTRLAAPAAESAVVDVQYRGRYAARWDRGPRWHHRRHWRGHHWRSHRRWRGHHRYWRGHRGYRHYRHGYRRHDGWWYPAGAFVAGAVIGSVITSAPSGNVRVRNYGSDHVQWCYNRYRSYRASDNTFQPYHGPRRPCRSPYY